MAILRPWNFHINFGISCQLCFHFKHTWPEREREREKRTSFLFISFNDAFLFSVFKSSVSLVQLIFECFLLFGIIITGIFLGLFNMLIFVHWSYIFKLAESFRGFLRTFYALCHLHIEVILFLSRLKTLYFFLLLHFSGKQLIHAGGAHL
jgi:hypothetical protein